MGLLISTMMWGSWGTPESLFLVGTGFITGMCVTGIVRQIRLLVGDARQLLALDGQCGQIAFDTVGPYHISTVVLRPAGGPPFFETFVIGAAGDEETTVQSTTWAAAEQQHATAVEYCRHRERPGPI
jgi:hypothetical protein